VGGRRVAEPPAFPYNLACETLKVKKYDDLVNDKNGRRVRNGFGLIINDKFED